MKKITCSTFAALLIIVSIAPAIKASEVSSGAPTLAELRNASYTGTGDGPITLLNGVWDGEPYGEGGASRPRAGLVEDVYFTGDLDGDGEQEAVVILWTASGGSGNNTYVVVMARQNNEIRKIGTALIGDRVKLRGGKVSAGQITLDVLQAGENDAMCCPTLLAVRTWSLRDGQLEEGEIEETGKLSLARLDGSKWTLTHLHLREPVGEGVEVTLAFDGERVSGKSACNRYSASIKDGEYAGNLQIGQSVSTRMACPEGLMKVEQRYLEALSQVTDFSFHGGGLVLNGLKEDGAPYSLLFIRTLTDTH